MEGSSLEPTSDWRSQVSYEFRQKLFQKIFDFMQKRVPVTQSTQGEIQLKNIVSQFEEKCFITATSQADYLRKVSIKMVSIEQKSQRTAGGGSSSTNSGIENLQQQQQQQQQSLLQPNQLEPFKQLQVQLGTSFQLDEATSQSTIQCNRQQRQLNSIQRPSPSQAQHHQPVGRQPQNPLVGQQSNISTQQSQLPAKQNELTSMKLATQHQSDSSQSGGQQQKQFVQSQTECPEVALSASSLTRSSHMQQQQQSLLQPNQSETFKQLHVQLGTSFQLDEATGQSTMQCNRQQRQLNSIQRPSSSQTQHHQPVGRQPQNPLVGQQSNISTQQSQLPAKQNELTNMKLATQHQSDSSQSGGQQQKQSLRSQTEHPEVTLSTAVDSTATKTSVSTADVQEEIYQKIKSMKTCLPELKEYYLRILQKIQEFQASKPSGNQLEEYERIKLVKHNLESIIKLLHISKDSIHPSLKEKIPTVEKRIAIFMASHKRRKNVLSESQGQQQFQQLDKHGQFTPEQQSSKNSPMHLNDHMSPVRNTNLQGEPAPVQSNIDPTRKSSLGFLQNSAGAPLSQKTLQFNSSAMQPGSNVQQDQNLQFDIHKKQRLTQQSRTQSIRHMNDEKEYMVRRDSDIRSLLYRQNHAAIGQQPKPGTPLQASTSQKLRSPSPQKFHSLYSQNDWTKSGARSQREKSAFIISSEPNAADTTKVAHQQTSLRETQVQPLAILTPGTSPSPLLEDFSSPQTCRVNAPEAHLGELRPIEKLIKMMQSLSPETLGSCISNIRSVVTMTDSMAGSVPGNGSRSEVGTDLSLSAGCNLQARNLMLRDGSSTKKRNHRITSMPVKASDCFDRIYVLDTSEMASSTMSNVIKQKTKINPSLLEEIKDINRKLIDIVVDIDEDGVVKCLFNPVAFTSDLKSMLSQHQIMPLRLRAPSNYPDGSPVILDELPDKACQENDELHYKIQERFRRSVRCMSHPMSLGEMVRTWNSSIREVIVEFVKKFGGGSFSLMSRGWQKRVPA